jgi:hypothetical protein
VAADRAGGAVDGILIRVGVTAEEVREVALALPGSYLAVVRDRVKIRVNRYVYLAFSRDETDIGLGFPKEERDAIIEAEPEKFYLPSKGDLRYNWIEVHLAALDPDEMRELVTDAWRMCVSKRTRDTYDATHEA